MPFGQDTSKSKSYNNLFQNCSSSERQSDLSSRSGVQSQQSKKIYSQFSLEEKSTKERITSQTKGHECILNQPRVTTNAFKGSPLSAAIQRGKVKLYKSFSLDMDKSQVVQTYSMSMADSHIHGMPLSENCLLSTETKKYFDDSANTCLHNEVKISKPYLDYENYYDSDNTESTYVASSSDDSLASNEG